MVLIQGVKRWTTVGAASARIVSWRVYARSPREEGNDSYGR